MDYLERDHVLLQEMSSVRFSNGLQTGMSLTGDKKPKTVFNCIGSYDSEFLACKLYAGLKRTLRHDSDTVRTRTAAELAVIKTIAQRYPHLTSELPVFYGLLVGKDGESLGSIAEDFSEGGLYKVEEMFSTFMVKHKELIPTELKEVFPDIELDEEDLARMCFVVNGRRRMGDFDALVTTVQTFCDIEFPRLYLNLDSYTLQLNYDL